MNCSALQLSKLWLRPMETAMLTAIGEQEVRLLTLMCSTSSLLLSYAGLHDAVGVWSQKCWAGRGQIWKG